MEITHTDALTALKEGFKSITTPYTPEQKWMLENALRDLRNVPHRVVLVKHWTANGPALYPEIWRKRSELKGDFK